MFNIDEFMKKFNELTSHPEFSKVIIASSHHTTPFLADRRYIEDEGIVINDPKLIEMIDDYESEVHGALITNEGQLNYTNLKKLKDKGFYHAITERDSFGPLCCKLTAPKFLWTYHYG